MSRQVEYGVALDSSAMSALEVLGRVYRAIVPVAIRQARGVSRAKEKLREMLLGHDATYGAEYYANVIEPTAAGSAGAISQSIVADLRPRSVIDVGCGTGALLEALRDRGCEVLGLEYSSAAIRFCRKRRLEVIKCDLNRAELTLDRTFDVAISLEVAEHLPEASAARYVALLSRLSDFVVLTAAPPGQGGVDHVNEQPKEYWVESFSRLGFVNDELLVANWSKSWREGGEVVAWYYENLMVFRRIAAPLPSAGGTTDQVSRVAANPARLR